jgi:hypothetical protein
MRAPPSRWRGRRGRRVEVGRERARGGGDERAIDRGNPRATPARWKVFACSIRRQPPRPSGATRHGVSRVGGTCIISLPS